MKKIIFSLLTLMTMLISCTDQEDIEISYKSNFEITAAHIFDDYTPLKEGDFDMSKHGWKLHINMFVYNEEGLLLDSVEMITDNISESFKYDNLLAPGNYTLMTIADFREGLGGKNFKFWNIANTHRIQDISITESESIYPVAFETLGIDLRSINVTDTKQDISIDIKPTTCLLQTFMCNNDYVGWGNKGFSRFTRLSEGYFIRALQTMNNVRYENGTLSYKCLEQLSPYPIAKSHVQKDIDGEGSPFSYIYRALLPEKDKQFTFNIQKRELPDDLYQDNLLFCGEFDTEGKSNVLSEVASNEQYILNMILDCLTLEFFEYTDNFNHETHNKQVVKQVQLQAMKRMVEHRYEKVLHKNELFVNTFINAEPCDHSQTESLFVSFYPRSHSSHFEISTSVGYIDENYSTCVIVDLLLPIMDENMIENLVNILKNYYRVEEDMTSGNIYCFLNPDDSVESKYRVVLNANEKDNITISYILRTKFF